MKLEHSFTVPVPVEEAWKVLRDVERVAPCMPGATLDSVEGEEFTGRVKVKVGPMSVTYRGQARFVDVDEEAHTATIEGKGTEARGSGTARATVSARLTGRGEETDVLLSTDLTVTGKPAQFGRGVMADVGAKLVGQFADCLSSELAVEEAVADRPEAATDAGVTPVEEPAPAGEPAAVGDAATTPARPRPSADAIDLLDVAGAPISKRLVPIAAVAALLILIVWLVRRRS